jgi:hypothetical protein
MVANIRSLREMLPAATSDSTHLPHEDHEYRIRRRLPFTIIGSVIGTLMGWFTQCRLNNLREQLSTDCSTFKQCKSNALRRLKQLLSNCMSYSKLVMLRGLVTAHWTMLVTNYELAYEN